MPMFHKLLFLHVVKRLLLGQFFVTLPLQLVMNKNTIASASLIFH